MSGPTPHFIASNDEADRRSADARTVRVVSLLNQLGDRMIRGEQERLAVREELGATRNAIEKLEKRSEASEKIFNAIQERLSKRDTLEAKLLARQDALENIVQENVERMKRAEALTQRIEDAIANQDRMARRLEKTAQDKAQILSKIERIHIGIEQTRQAMGTRAVARAANANDSFEDDGAADGWAALFPRARMTRVALVASMLVAGLMGGAAMHLLIQNWPGLAGSGLNNPPSVIADNRADTVTVSPGRFATTSTAPEDLAPYGDIYNEAWAMDDASRVAAFDADPDALAAVLNTIEPSDTPVQKSEAAPAPVTEPDLVADLADAGVEDTEVVLESVLEHSAEATEAVAQLPSAEASLSEAFVRENTNRSAPLASRIQKDSKLPDALRKIEEKAFEGVPEAQHDLAAIYTAGHGGVAVDYKRAALWFEEAAANGVGNARYNLGVLYHQGLGVPRDVTKAIGWYRAAAALNHPEAQYNLGIAFIEGIGTQYNPRAAAQNFERSARGGVKEAAYNLGLIHENGLLGQVDMNEAVFWYKTAADHSPEAKVALDQVTKALGLRSSDVDRIMREYDKVYRLGSAAGSSPSAVTAAPLAPGAETQAQIDSLVRAAPTMLEDPLADVIPKLSAEESAILIRADRDHIMTAQIQEQLMRLGLFPGPADGKVTAQFEDAIRAYEDRAGMRPTGKPSEDLLVHMLATEINAASGGFEFDFEEMGSRAE